MFLSFPLNHFPIYNIILNSDLYKNIILEKIKNNNFKIFLFNIFFRSLILIFIFLIVYINPNFIQFLSWAGSLMTYFLAIWFPVLLYNKVFKNNKKKKFEIRFNYFYLTIGTFITLIISIHSIKNLI